MKNLVRFLGRKVSTNGTSLVDRPVAHDGLFAYAGRLQVALAQGNYAAMVTALSTSWAMKQGGTSTSPLVLRRIEVVNSTSGALTFRLAIMTTPSGSPAPSNAFLAWDISVAAYGTWSWEGEVPLIDRYVYAKANGSGLVMRIETRFITP